MRWIVGCSVSCIMLSVLTAGCDIRPCRCTCVPPPASLSSMQPAAPQISASVASAGIPPAASVAARGRERLVVWDGDAVDTHASGWADCNAKPNCRASIESIAGGGRNGGVGLKFHAEGAGWVGAGWNLFGWYPADAGFNLGGYKYLKLDLRIAANPKTNGPDPLTFGVSLGCSGKKPKCASSTLLAAEFAREDLTDGNWHEVTFPVSEFSKSPDFDEKSVWEIDIGTWAEGHRKFEIFFDNFALSD